MTASSDYGVSIVETFTPPENWIPGQVINKDVYAVNTGNIEAFVEEEVSGLLTYSYEVLVGTFGAAGVDYEELDANALKAAEAKEAGGYLIWNNAGAENGPVGTNFTPTVSGDYIFRRSVDKATNNGGTDVSKETYALEGYHYDKVTNKYYKINIGSNANELGDRAYVGMNAAGTALAADPVIQYYTIHEATAKPVSLNYKTDDGKYLEAVYQTEAGATGTAAYATDAATAQKIVENANTVALHDGRKALADLGDAQITAINAVQAKAKDVKDKADAYITAYNDVYGDGGSDAGSKAETETAGDAVYDKTDTSEYSLDALPGHGTSAGQVNVIDSTDVAASTLTAEAKAKVNTALTNYSDAEIAYGNARTALGGAIADLHDSAIQSGTMPKANVTALQTAFDNAATAFYNAAVNLKNAYANLETQVHDSGLNVMANNSESITTLTDIVSNAAVMKEGAGTGNYRDDLDALIDAYETARGQYETDSATLAQAKEDYFNACEAYGNASTGVLKTASDTYDTATNAFNTAKAKSKSTDELTDGTFGDIVNSYKVPTGGTIAASSVSDSDAKTAANIATTYAAAAVDESYVPNVTGSDATGTAVSDTNYQGSVSALKTTLNSTANDYNSAKAYIDSLTSGSPEANAAAAANAAHTIKIKINLDNDVETNWSQIPTTTNNTVAHFYLNKVLDAGETSKKLIDSVELDGESTTPASFKDMTFDLNVALKSAQVTYDENNNITHTAADSTFTGASVTAVDSSTKAVTWTELTPAPAGGGSETPATTNVDVIVAGAATEHNLIKMVKTGTGATATWAVAGSGSTITDASTGYHYTVNGEGIYRSVTGLTVALNAVTGDTTPAVVYVADD